MKILSIIALLIAVSIFSNAQTFHVIARDNKTKTTIEDQLKYDGFSVTDSLSKYDFELEFMVTGEYKVVTLKNTHQGYMVLRLPNTSTILYKTKVYKTSPAAINGYNASNAIAHKIIRKEFDDIMATVQKNYK